MDDATREARQEATERGDTFEFEGEAADSIGSSRAGVARNRRRWRGALVSLSLAVVVTLLLLLTFHEGGARPSALHATPPSQHTSQNNGLTGATPALPVSTPPVSALAAAPGRCPGQSATATTSPGSAQIGQINYYATPAYGVQPVWMLGLQQEQQRRVVHFEMYPPLPYTSQGWRWRILLVSAPGYSAQVTLSGMETGGGTPTALYLDAGSGLTQLLVLDPRAPAMSDLTTSGQHWAEWPIYVYLPGPGCYQMGARWPGGGWQISFAAGV